MSDAPAQPMAKGTNILGIVWAIENQFGAEPLASVLKGLSPELTKVLVEKSVVVGGWYPLGWYKELHREAQKVTGQGPQLAFDLAHAFVAHQLGGIYRALLSLISPHWLFNYPSLIFSRYFSTGALKIPENRAGYVRGEWSGCLEFDHNIWNATFGGCRAALEGAGAKEVRIDCTAGGHDGDTTATAVGTWK